MSHPLSQGEVLLLTPGGISETEQPPPTSLHLSRAENNETRGITPNPKGPPDPSTPATSTALPQSGASTQRHSPFLLFDSHSALGNKDTPWKEVNYKWNEKVPPSVSVAFSLVHRTAHHHKRVNRSTRTPTLSDPTPFMCSSIISLL